MAVKVESQYLELLTVAILAQTVLMVYRDKMELLQARTLVSEALEERPLAVKVGQGGSGGIAFFGGTANGGDGGNAGNGGTGGDGGSANDNGGGIGGTGGNGGNANGGDGGRVAAVELPWVLALPQMEERVALGQTAVLAAPVAQLMHLLEVLAVWRQRRLG